MPKQQSVTIADDFDNKPLPEDTEPIRLEWSGQAFNLYLSDKNAKDLTKYLAQYTEGAEPATGRAIGATKMPKAEREALMNWSRETEGIAAVAERGAVKRATLEAWEKAGKPGYDE